MVYVTSWKGLYDYEFMLNIYENVMGGIYRSCDTMTSSLHHLLGLFSPSEAASAPLSTTCADDVAFFFVLH